MMNDDPIIAEVRKIREQYARRFNYDLDAICQDLKGRQKRSGRRVVSFPPKRVLEKAPVVREGNDDLET
jgi:hypothetical protein